MRFTTSCPYVWARPVRRHTVEELIFWGCTEEPADGPSVIALIREVKSGTHLAHIVPTCARTRHSGNPTQNGLYGRGDASASAPQEVHLVGPVHFPGLASERNQGADKPPNVCR
jgi:hypothetical protein